MEQSIDVCKSLNRGDLLYSRIYNRFYLKYPTRSGIGGCIEIKGPYSKELAELLDEPIKVMGKELYLACVGSLEGNTFFMGSASTSWVLVRSVCII